MSNGDTLTPGQRRLAKANRKRLRASETKAAERLRNRGWICLTPEQVATLPEAVKAIISHPQLGKLGHDTERPAQSYSERRPYAVAENLDALTGPTTGTITLPHRIDWSGSPTHDLDNPGMLRSVYQTILTEAFRQEDLNNFLNRAALIRLWPDMFLPAKVRRLWEERFPELAATRTENPPCTPSTNASPASDSPPERRTD